MVRSGVGVGGGLDFNLAGRLDQRPTPQDYEARNERLRAAVRANILQLVRDLYPRAVVKGSDARIGDVFGDPGGSMSICLAGEKCGTYFDHATAKGGDLIELWQLSQGYNGADAFDLARDDLELHLGIKPGAKWDGPVARVASERAKAPKPPAAVKVGERVHVYTSADGATVLAKAIRREMSDGSKTFLQKNAADEWKAPEVSPLYNLPGVAACEVVVLVEGEKCADALGGVGIVASTMMGGAGVSTPGRIEKTDWSPLIGKRVLLWPDNDDAGRAHMERVAKHLRGLGVTVSAVTIPADAPAKWDAADAVEAGGEAAAVAVLETARAALVAVELPRFVPRGFEGAVPPPRPWAYGDFLMYRAVTGVAAPPGVGKTTFSVQLGVAFALDMQFGTWKPVSGGGGKAWLYNGEEPREELDRRYIASCMEMGVQEADAAGRFSYNSGLDERLTFIRMDPKSGELVRSPDVDLIKQTIVEHGFKLFIVDPLIEFHAAKEDTEGFHAIGAVLREIANDCDCAVLFFHHTPKAANSDTAAGDMNAMRGGGPIVGVARFVATMFAMTEKDAGKYRIPAAERTSYVRFDDAKANMTVVSGEPQWWVKLGVCIDNASDVRPADNIGVLRPVTLGQTEEETGRQRELKADATLQLIGEEMARICRANGHTSPAAAATLNAICQALVPASVGVGTSTVKSTVASKMGAGMSVEGGRIVIMNDPRGRQTIRRVHFEASDA